MTYGHTEGLAYWYYPTTRPGNVHQDVDRARKATPLQTSIVYGIEFQKGKQRGFAIAADLTRSRICLIIMQ